MSPLTKRNLVYTKDHGIWNNTMLLPDAFTLALQTVETHYSVLQMKFSPKKSGLFLDFL